MEDSKQLTHRGGEHGPVNKLQNVDRLYRCCCGGLAYRTHHQYGHRGGQYQQQSDVGFYLGQEIVAAVIGPLGLLAIAVGFWVLRAAPDLGILLVAAGSFAVAVLFAWLIIPFVVAIGVSAYAVHRAKRMRK